MKNRLFIFLLFSILSLTLGAQVDSAATYEGEFGGLFQLDEVVVKASRSGFDLDDFVKMVQEDTSFYQSFRSIRFLNYQGKHDLKMFDKKGAEKSFYQSEVSQKINGPCREINIFQETFAKNYYKRKKNHRFYTGKLLDVLFQQSACEASSPNNTSDHSSGRTSKHIQELKKLIFQPGQKANVPMIGNKTAIFDPKMAVFYDFSIRSNTYKGNIDCYVFKAILKPEFQTKKQDKTVVKYLETYFDKSNFAIVSRNYHLSYYGVLYDFDVKMNIECSPFENSFIPTWIEYDGFWDIPGRKPEIGKFTIGIKEAVRP